MIVFKVDYLKALLLSALLFTVEADLIFDALIGTVATVSQVAAAEQEGIEWGFLANPTQGPQISVCELHKFWNFLGEARQNESKVIVWRNLCHC